MAIDKNYDGQPQVVLGQWKNIPKKWHGFLWFTGHSGPNPLRKGRIIAGQQPGTQDQPPLLPSPPLGDICRPQNGCCLPLDRFRDEGVNSG